MRFQLNAEMTTKYLAPFWICLYLLLPEFLLSILLSLLRFLRDSHESY